MSRQKKGKAVVSTGKEPLKSPDRKNSRLPIFVFVAVLLVIATLIGGIIYYRSNVAPYQQPVMTVDNKAVPMGYFLKRLKMSGMDINAVLQQMAGEEVIKQQMTALGAKVDDADIQNELIYEASVALSENASNPAQISQIQFKDWYNQQIKRTGLTDAEFKDIVKVNILSTDLQKALVQSIPVKTEQIHLHLILVANATDANKARSRIAAGESFASVARAVSLDTQSKANGGDVGWIPRGALPLEDITFALDIGNLSDPVPVNAKSPTTTQYLIFMVSEKSPSRDISANVLELLKANALSNWLSQEMPAHKISVTYDFSNPQNQAWINWQLTKIGNAD